MKKILFLHGFYASGQCVPAMALRDAFEGRRLGDGTSETCRVEVLTPDLPMHPKDAIEYIRELIDHEKPDLLVGNSCGSFYAQMLAPFVGIPALLGNPHFQMTEFLKQRIGEHQYKSPRKDGMQDFVINEALVEEFAELEAIQFNYCNPYYKDRIWGLFGEQDTLAHYEPLFLEYYNQSFHFPGGHTPTAASETPSSGSGDCQAKLKCPRWEPASGHRTNRNYCQPEGLAFHGQSVLGCT